MKDTADQIVKKVESCQHSYKPFDLHLSHDLFNTPIYTWTSVCEHCGQSIYSTSKNKEDIPKKFEAIPLRDNNIY